VVRRTLVVLLAVRSAVLVVPVVVVARTETAFRGSKKIRVRLWVG
jgi:hypothetical protein